MFFTAPHAMCPPVGSTVLACHACYLEHTKVNQRKGVRLSAYRAFLKPVMHRSNLTVRTSCTTEKLLFDTNRDNSSGPPVAIGVQYSKTRKEAVGADAPTRVGLKQGGELILSAGAINSPHLLQLSGVGPAELLRQNGVEPLVRVLVWDIEACLK